MAIFKPRVLVEYPHLDIMSCNTGVVTSRSIQYSCFKGKRSLGWLNLWVKSVFFTPFISYYFFFFFLFHCFPSHPAQHPHQISSFKVFSKQSASPASKIQFILLELPIYYRLINSMMIFTLN